MDWKKIKSNGKQPRSTMNQRTPVICIDSHSISLRWVLGSSSVQKVDLKLHIAVTQRQVADLVVGMHMTIAVNESD